jgi:hypothetical protein
MQVELVHLQNFVGPLFLVRKKKKLLTRSLGPVVGRSIFCSFGPDLSGSIQMRILLLKLEIEDEHHLYFVSLLWYWTEFVVGTMFVDKKVAVWKKEI